MNRKEKLKLSICMPAYNGADTIAATLKSILAQNYQNLEIIVNDDGSTDATEKVVKYFKDKRIKFFKNKKNLGYGDNLNAFKSKITGDIMIFMAQDDILLKDALLKIASGFMLDDDIGVVARPFYQFENDPTIPVRYWPPPSTKKDTIITINSKRELIEAVIRSAYLISCVALRVKFIDRPFTSHVFTSQSYPYWSIFKKHKALFLKDYIVAVGIYQSQCRYKPSIYEPSPVATWIEVFNVILPEKKYDKVRKICQDYVAQNYVGLVQIKNWARTQDLLEEIYMHVKYRKASLIDKRFWIYTLICLFTPSIVLRKVVDVYKSKILSKAVSNKVHIELAK
ncbi:MAG: glycosyltransferase family A protein [Candidatus Levybacteria bacterium]|nr:glycosyltransferase family A protein [Candidatus Levybacteria bacterium]